MSTLHDVSRKLIETDTTSDRPNAAALEFLADRAESLGFDVRLQRWAADGGEKANLVATLGPARPDGLVLSGHVDTVPFADQPGWQRDALTLGLEDERVYGRGTSDMKIFLAQCLAAVEQLRARDLVRPLVLLFTSDEEVGCLGSRRLVDELDALLGQMPRPRLAWIGEPTSWQVFHAHKGVISFDVEVTGEGGHSSVPAAGVNAIAVAARVVDILGELQLERRAAAAPAFLETFPDAPYTTVNVGRIQGGSAMNMIAESCRLVISYRPLPDEAPRALWEELGERIREADLPDWASGRGARVEIGDPDVVPGMSSQRDTALERALVDRFGRPDHGGAPFATDGGRFAAAGIDSLICGPGELDQAHQANESIRREAYEKGPAHIASVVRRICMSRSAMSSKDG